MGNLIIPKITLHKAAMPIMKPARVGISQSITVTPPHLLLEPGGALLLESGGKVLL